jgi:hypothetical protein
MADDKRITVSIGKSKKELKDAAAELKRGLKLWGATLPLAKRLQYEAAIIQLEISTAVLEKVKCDPPQMTFELGASAGETAATAKKRARRRSR